MRRTPQSCCCCLIFSDPKELIRTMAAVEGRGEEQRRQLVVRPGFRFLPTDEELLTVFLANEVAGTALPCGILHIPFRELYVPGADPWIVQRELAFPHGKNGEFYCFTRLSRCGSGTRRTPGSGTWAAKGKNVEVRAKGTQKLLGHKLQLKFVPQDGGGSGSGSGSGAKKNDPRCNWIMHEYRLPSSSPASPSSYSSGLQFQEIVLCKIFQRCSKKERGSPAASEGSDVAISLVVTDYSTSSSC